MNLESTPGQMLMASIQLPEPVSPKECQETPSISPSIDINESTYFII